MISGIKLDCDLPMMMKEERGFQKTRSFHFKKMFEIPGRLAHSSIFEHGENRDGFEERPYRGPGSKLEEIGSILDIAADKGPISRLTREPLMSVTPKERPHSDMDLMKERFAKLLLGEDMSGGGKGVSSALALSNAITNLAASVFGEQKKLEPMAPDRKARWKKEIDWLLSVTDHIVELVPAQQKSKDGTNMEIMVTQQRKDLLMNIPALRKLDAMLIDCLDNFSEESNEFWYVSRDADESEQGTQRNDKWWLPTVKICPEGLSDSTRKWLQYQKDCVNQVLKASMAINAQIVSEMDIPEDYIENLPKNGRSSLGENIYKNITVEFFDPGDFLSNMDLSTEHKVLDLKNRIEASIVIWRRKMHKDGKSSWGSAVSLEKRELFEERAETILLLLKLRFPGLPQSSLDISKIQFNKDVGHAVLESYSRVLESLAYTVMSRVEDVLYADSLQQDPSIASDRNNPSTPLVESNRTNPSTPLVESNRTSSALDDSDKIETPSSMTLSDFMGWEDSAMKKQSSTNNLESLAPEENENRNSGEHSSKKLSYIEKIGALSGLRSPTRL